MRKALAVLVLTIVFVSAMSPGEGQEGEEGEKEIILKETRITDDSAHQLYPDIWGDIITWTDYRYNDDGDIYYLDLQNKLEKTLTNNTSSQRFSKISGSIIVWEEQISELYRNYFYSFESNDKRMVSDTHSNKPSVFLDTIVWLDRRNVSADNNGDIYGYSITNKNEFLICINNATQSNPVIWGDIVVWQDFRYGNWDVFYYDLREKKETQINNDTYFQSNPSIWGDRVVWLDFRYRSDNDVEKKDIYYYNLTTNEEKRITNVTTSWGSPSIWGDNIVWARAGMDEIYIYNIPTNKTYTIYMELASNYVSIYENRIAFVDNRNGNPDIYMLEFTFQRPPAPPDPSFWEQNRMPIGLGIVFIIVAMILVFSIRVKKGRNREENNK